MPIIGLLHGAKQQHYHPDVYRKLARRRPKADNWPRAIPSRPRSVSSRPPTSAGSAARRLRMSNATASAPDIRSPAKTIDWRSTPQSLIMAPTISTPASNSIGRSSAGIITRNQRQAARFTKRALRCCPPSTILPGPTADGISSSARGARTMRKTTLAIPNSSTFAAASSPMPTESWTPHRFSDDRGQRRIGLRVLKT